MKGTFFCFFFLFLPIFPTQSTRSLFLLFLGLCYDFKGGTHSLFLLLHCLKAQFTADSMQCALGDLLYRCNCAVMYVFLFASKFSHPTCMCSAEGYAENGMETMNEACGLLTKDEQKHLTLKPYFQHRWRNETKLPTIKVCSIHLF